MHYRTRTPAVETSPDWRRTVWTGQRESPPPTLALDRLSGEHNRWLNQSLLSEVLDL